jgi:hypothetical protein
MMLSTVSAVRISRTSQFLAIRSPVPLCPVVTVQMHGEFSHNDINWWGDRQQRRGRAALNGCRAGFGQILEHVSLLLAQGDDRGQHSLDEATTRFALGTETSPPPQHRSAQWPLGVIVGGFDALDRDEGPQRLFQFQDILAGPAGLVVSQLGAFTQKFSHSNLDGCHLGLKGRPAQGAILDLVPQVEHLPRLVKQCLPNPLRFTSTVYEGLKVSIQVCPTYGSSIRFYPVVGRIPIRTHDSLEGLAQYLSGLSPTSTREQPENCDLWSGVDPQPGATCVFAPTGLVYIVDRLLSQVCLRLIHWLGQGITHPAFYSRYGAQPHVGMEDRLHHFLHIPLAHSNSPRQVPYCGLNSWPKTARRHVGRPLGAVLRSASQTRDGVTLVFHHFGLHWWQFRDLMACRLRVFAQQQSPTLLTALWFDCYDSVNLLRRFELAPVPAMPFLPPALAPRSSSLWTREGIRRIRRWWPRRITRVLPQLLAQSGHFDLQGFNFCLQRLFPLPQRDNHCLHSKQRVIPIFSRHRQVRWSVHDIRQSGSVRLVDQVTPKSQRWQWSCFPLFHAV